MNAATIVGRYPAIDRCLLELVLSTDGGPSMAWCITDCHGASLFMAESHAPLNTPKRREHSLIYAAVNLTPEYTPNRRLRYRRFNVLLKLTTDRHETARGLFTTAESFLSGVSWPRVPATSVTVRQAYIISVSQSWAGRPLLPVLLAVGLHIHQRTKFIFLPRLISEISESKNSQSGSCLYPRRSQAEI